MDRSSVNAKIVMRALAVVAGIILIMVAATQMNGYEGSPEAANFLVMIVGTILVVAGLFPLTSTAGK